MANDFIQDKDQKQLKSSSAKSIEEFIKFVWSKHHDKQLKRSNYRQPILKSQDKIKSEWPDVGVIDSSSAISVEEKENKIVFFEDELYQKERQSLKIQISDFKKLIQKFIDSESNQSVVVDINNEFQQLDTFNQEGKQNLDYIFPNMPLVVANGQDNPEFDFIKENIERTLQQYQRLYEVADFRTGKERQFLSDLIHQMQQQLDQYQVKKAQKNAPN